MNEEETKSIKTLIPHQKLLSFPLLNQESCFEILRLTLEDQISFPSCVEANEY